MIKMQRQIAREQAVIGIYQYLLVDATMEEIETSMLDNKKLKNDEDAFAYCKQLIETTIENKDQYQEEIVKHLKSGWKIERLSMMERAILLIGACELLDIEIPKSVVLNEAVLLAKKYCDDESYKFVNGILHAII